LQSVKAVNRRVEKNGDEKLPKFNKKRDEMLWQFEKSITFKLSSAKKTNLNNIN
jgi:hypothetical protein